MKKALSLIYRSDDVPLFSFKAEETKNLVKFNKHMKFVLIIEAFEIYQL